MNVVGTLFFRPSTTIDVSLGPARFGFLLSGTQSTLYPVMFDPPFEMGVFQIIVAAPTPATPDTPKTEDGGPATGALGKIALDTREARDVPTEFMATTVNVRGNIVPKPVSVVVRTFSTVTTGPLEGVIVYPVTIAPPFESGAAQVSVAEFIPATAVTAVGAPGTERGMTEYEAADADENPILFIAFTVKLTGVPSIRPGTVAIKTFPTVTSEPAEGITTYPVISEPPSDVGAYHVTVAERLPEVAYTPVGTPGSDAGVSETGAEGTESPTLFLATTVNVRANPFVSPVKVAVRTFPTVIG